MTVEDPKDHAANHHVVAKTKAYEIVHNIVLDVEDSGDMILGMVTVVASCAPSIYNDGDVSGEVSYSISCWPDNTAELIQMLEYAIDRMKTEDGVPGIFPLRSKTDPSTTH